MSRPSPGAARSPVRLSVVAPTYERREGLPAFVAAVLEDPAVDELVLAVDGSTDGSLEWLRARAREDPRIVALELPNRGVAAARQAGVEAAKGEIVLLLDDDVIPAPGLATGHAGHHHGGGRALLLGYMPNDWSSLPPGRRGIAYIYRSAYERRCEHYERDPGFVLHGLWAGNFSLPREVLLEVGASPIAVKRGEEDREFGLRCLKAGIGGVFDRRLLAAHDFDRSLAQYRRDCNMAGEYRRLMFDLHADILGGDLALGSALPRPLARLLPLLARDPLFAAPAAILTALFNIGTRLRSLRLEAFAARGLGSLETLRGTRGWR